MGGSSFVLGRSWKSRKCMVLRGRCQKHSRKKIVLTLSLSLSLCVNVEIMVSIGRHRCTHVNTHTSTQPYPIYELHRRRQQMMRQVKQMHYPSPSVVVVLALGLREMFANFKGPTKKLRKTNDSYDTRFIFKPYIFSRLNKLA